jgi:mercuric ion transport protein
VKTALASLIGATAASACCIGPVVFTLAGVGAMSASVMWLEPLRPALILTTALLVGSAFWREYRSPRSCQDAPVCRPRVRRTRRVLLWLVAGAVVALVAFPYYINTIL